MIHLSFYDLLIAAALIALLATLSWHYRLGLTGQLIVASLRTLVQLLLVGLILKVLFETPNIWLLTLIACVMLAAASREVLARQKYPFKGWWGYGLSSGSMFISSFTVTLLALTVIIENQPWYSPQYAIPLLGMLLGNTMTGIALSLDRLSSDAYRQKNIIEQRLMLGQNSQTAIHHIKSDSLRAGLMPTINAMATAGLVSLPGMMTGQILAGSPPVEAVKYQILILFLITAGTGFGTLCAVSIASRHLFDERHRLRLDKLRR
ncbi:MAG: iron export ABC transporter permease subunit FetB [Gammaproteobacteria bacterium]|nr:iron export ABC transporter permease subunit FetB [Gammaproteobacteria bacterium]MDH5799420.1 iron export ABC transporter permease subunit FetB [Gammaproteobacteria bacterium]